jgi:hypothetical protein
MPRENRRKGGREEERKGGLEGGGEEGRVFDEVNEVKRPRKETR